ncbi:MAG TPA: hypothetical protein VHO06_24835 [Polyangia bacterium]|nr:hypothetical protein [Polyangia bacterium]
MTAVDDGAAAIPSPLEAGAAALRRFWRPFVLIQAAAALVGLAYWVSGPFRAACALAAAWKTSGGLPFAAASTAVAGGLLPELAKLVADRGRSSWRGRGGEIAFNTAFFAANGVVIDLLYRGEAVLFGNDARVSTVMAKVAFDQFVFTPLWLIVIVWLFLWRQRGYSLAATLPALRRGFYRARVVPLLIPDWLFWIPMVSIIYALPVALQFLLFVPALGAWSLIMVFIADR